MHGGSHLILMDLPEGLIASDEASGCPNASIGSMDRDPCGNIHHFHFLMIHEVPNQILLSLNMVLIDEIVKLSNQMTDSQTIWNSLG